MSNTPQNISSHTVSLFYLEGREARRKGIVVGDNPYDETDDRHWEWMRGWVAEAKLTFNNSFDRKKNDRSEEIKSFT